MYLACLSDCNANDHFRACCNPYGTGVMCWNCMPEPEQQRRSLLDTMRREGMDRDACKVGGISVAKGPGDLNQQ